MLYIEHQTTPSASQSRQTVVVTAVQRADFSVECVKRSVLVAVTVTQAIPTAKDLEDTAATQGLVIENRRSLTRRSISRRSEHLRMVIKPLSA